MNKFMKDMGRMISYETTTKIVPSLKDSVLTLDTEMDGIIKQHYQERVDFKDETVRKALIELGWTPPEENR